MFAKVLTAFFSAILSFIGPLIEKWLAARAARQANEAINKELREQLENAITVEERNAIAKKIAERFNS